MSERKALRTLGPSKLLAEAKTAAGDRAVSAAKDENHFLAREWGSLAGEIQTLFTKAVELSARG